MKIGSKTYFQPLVDSLDCKETQKELFNYLANFNITDFHPQRPPMTAYKKSMIADQQKDIVRFVQDLCENCTDVEFNRNVDVIVPYAAKFYKVDYRNWCEENGFRATDRARFDTDILETFGIENVKQRFDGKQYRGIN